MCLSQLDGHHCEIFDRIVWHFLCALSAEIFHQLPLFEYSISILFSELYFLISKFLANGPFKHVGEVTFQCHFTRIDSSRVDFFGRLFMPKNFPILFNFAGAHCRNREETGKLFVELSFIVKYGPCLACIAAYCQFVSCSS